MLTNLEINNGKLTPKFDIYNDNYTVTIEEDVEQLDISYEVSKKNISVVINGNENLNEENKVVSITVADGNIIKNINLNIIQENSSATLGLQNYFEALEVKKQEEIAPFVAPLIASGCFLIIVIVFAILFHKKKKFK